MKRPSPAEASSLIVTMATLTALSLMAAFALTRVLPRLRMAYQNAAWEEARLAAEAGVDAALADILRYSNGSTPPSWAGWKQDNNGTPGPVLSDPLGSVTN